MKRFLTCLCLIGFALSSHGASDRAHRIEHIASSNDFPRAVVVSPGALVYTASQLPLDATGNLVGKDDVTKQTDQALVNLTRALLLARTALANVVKLNVYLAKDDLRSAVTAALVKKFSAGNRPAVTFVTGTLEADAMVALDAVATTSSVVTSVLRFSDATNSGIAAAAILPPESKLYVSGMAESGALLPATRATLEKLVACIDHLGSKRNDIVQLKVFLQPMSEVGAVRQVIVDFFKGQAPPTVFVEWLGGNPSVEIELIAATRPVPDWNFVSFFTPPGTTDSKVYRRVARVNGGKLIFISGLNGTNAADGAGQIREIFETLRGIAEETGSNMEQLVKATYYVSDNEASAKLNELRPQYYNPLRPPAASKAMVRGTGASGKTVTIDMIAVSKNSE